jgi:hypothetical protein
MFDEDDNCFVKKDVAFDPTGKEFPEEGTYSYIIGIRNNFQDKTIQNYRFLIHGDDIVKHFWLSRGFQARDIDPAVIDKFVIISISEAKKKESKEHDPQDSHNKRGRFTIRARGRDVREAIAIFEYTPDQVPMIRRLG